MANYNIKPRFTSENQPPNRGRKKGSSPTDWLRRLSHTKINFQNPLTGKVEKGEVALVTAIQLVLKATQDGDLGAMKEIFDRLDGKVVQKLLNEMSGELKLMGTIKLNGESQKVNIGD